MLLVSGNDCLERLAVVNCKEERLAVVNCKELRSMWS